MVSWEQCKADFRPDGTLRDIYITPATLRDWQAIYPWLCSCPGAEYTVGGQAQSPPADVRELFPPDREFLPMLSIPLGRGWVLVHFFSDEEIECDIDPGYVTCQSDLDALLRFLQTLGDKAGRWTSITPQNSRQEPIISYDPQTHELRFHPLPTGDSARCWPDQSHGS